MHIGQGSQVFSDMLAAGSNGVDFRVGGAVDRGEYRIVGRGDYLVALGNGAAERAIARGQSLAGFFDRQTH
jgi:hypothetical protein